MRMDILYWNNKMIENKGLNIYKALETKKSYYPSIDY